MIQIRVLVHRISLLHDFRQIQPLVDVAGEESEDIVQEDTKAANMRPRLDNLHESRSRFFDQARLPQEGYELFSVIFEVSPQLLGLEHDLRQIALGVDQIAAKCLIHCAQKLLVILWLSQLYNHDERDEQNAQGADASAPARFVLPLAVELQRRSDAIHIPAN